MPKNTKILLTAALLLASLTAVILYNSSTVFLQLFIAFALAYMLNPAVEFLERRRVNRIASILIVFIAALVACAGFGRAAASSCPRSRTSPPTSTSRRASRACSAGPSCGSSRARACAARCATTSPC